MSFDPSQRASSDVELSQRFVVFICKLFIVVLLLWCIAALATQFWLAYHVPLSEEDLRSASWLGTPLLALHLGQGWGTKIFLLGVVGVGATFSYLKRTWPPVLLHILVAVCLTVSATERVQVRAGLLEGTVRLGCFVPNTLECNRMLGLPTTGLEISKYAKVDGRPHDGSWTRSYHTARKGSISEEKEQLARLMSVPGVLLVLSPFHMNELPRLVALVAEQRQALEQLRSQHPGGAAN